jgi:hypothetical protein
MKVIDIEKYRKSKRIKGESTREKLVNQFAEMLRRRLRLRMSLQRWNEKQSKARTKEPPSEPS